MATTGRRHRCRGVVPPYVLEEIATHGTGELADRARRTLDVDRGFRQDRVGRAPAAPGPRLREEEDVSARRTVSDAGNARTLPGTAVRREGEPPTGDAAADEAYDGLGATWALLRTAYGRDSVDGAGLPLLATVHYGVGYDNAFWDGTQMVFGDGDGTVFTRFTASVDVIGHELGHGVTEHSARLMYQGEPGSLNESVSDVIGSLVKQWVLGQTAGEADWLIGAELLTDAVQGVALRSMKAPGTAYDDPVLGRDPQPGNMDDYVVTSADNGGVHTNSGIPNHAFYLAATGIGGYAWEGAGAVWYDTLTGDIDGDCDFETFARLTVAAATARFGEGSMQEGAVRSAWEQVGVLQVTGPPDLGSPASSNGHARAGRPDGSGTSSRGVAVPDDPESWTQVAATPPPESEVVLVRTGGVAGLRREVRITLDDLPEPDVRAWQTVLASQEIRILGRAASFRPDAFCYRVACREVGVDVDLPEPHIPDRLLELLERTLERARR